MSIKNTYDCDVLVIGAGGCGLALSVFLADKQVNFLTIEKHASTSILPKAHYLNPRSMEIFRQHNMADAIHELGTPPYNMSRTKWFTTFAGNEPEQGLTLFECASLGGHGADTSEWYSDCCATRSANLPQLRLEPIIRQQAESRAPEQIRFDHELLDFEQDDDGVTATIKNRQNDTTFTVRAKYMVAADAGKTVGPTLGIVLEGPTQLITQISIHFEADLSTHYPDDRVLLNWIKSLNRPGVSALVAMGPDKWGRHSPEWSWGFSKLPNDPETLTDDWAIAEIRKALGISDLAINIRCISPWTVEGVLANRYQDRRIFVAGDAAHRHPPTTGLGLNTGIQDAHNLAWKLAMVTSGKASPSLLETYQQERRPIGKHNVEWALNAFFNHLLLDAGINAVCPDNLADMQTPAHTIKAYQALLADTPNGRMSRARLERVFKTQGIEYFAQDIEMGFVYASTAIIDDGSIVPARDPEGQHYQPITRPGHRLPHCWLDNGRGEKASTHDLVTSSGHFALLVTSNENLWQDASEKVLELLGVLINVVVIGKHGDFYDTEARWHKLKSVASEGAVLVRPDNIVAWVSQDSLDAKQALLTAIRQILNGGV